MDGAVPSYRLPMAYVQRPENPDATPANCYWLPLSELNP
jgi:hypothetical protein